LRGHAGAVIDARFSPKGERIVTASMDRTARVWNVKTGTQSAVLEGHSGWVSSAAFSPDGERIVTSASDGTTGVWEARTGKNLALARRHGDSVNSAAFSPDGKLILTASDDGTARIYPCETCGSLDELRRLAKERLRLVPEQGVPSEAPPDNRATVPTKNLKVGDCYDQPGATVNVREVTLVPCDQPHDREVFAVLGYPAAFGEPYDRQALDDFQGCKGRPFETYVGTALPKSPYEVRWWYPAEQSWAAGDRQVTCTLYDPSGQLTGSVRDRREVS